LSVASLDPHYRRKHRALALGFSVKEAYFRAFVVEEYSDRVQRAHAAGVCPVGVEFRTGDARHVVVDGVARLVGAGESASAVGDTAVGVKTAFRVFFVESYCKGGLVGECGCVSSQERWGSGWLGARSKNRCMDGVLGTYSPMPTPQHGAGTTLRAA
jgi:hypothetical protein